VCEFKVLRHLSEPFNGFNVKIKRFMEVGCGINPGALAQLNQQAMCAMPNRNRGFISA
jgi:hypothetical protein